MGKLYQGFLIFDFGFLISDFRFLGFAIRELDWRLRIGDRPPPSLLPYIAGLSLNSYSAIPAAVATLSESTAAVMGMRAR